MHLWGDAIDKSCNRRELLYYKRLSMTLPFLNGKSREWTTDLFTFFPPLNAIKTHWNFVLFHFFCSPSFRDSIECVHSHFNGKFKFKHHYYYYHKNNNNNHWHRYTYAYICRMYEGSSGTRHLIARSTIFFCSLSIYRAATSTSTHSITRDYKTNFMHRTVFAPSLPCHAINTMYAHCTFAQFVCTTVHWQWWHGAEVTAASRQAATNNSILSNIIV